MTTSTLSPLAYGLEKSDLQVIRDFALEAPWAWQKTLQNLCDLAEKFNGDLKSIEDAEKRIEDLEIRVEVANEHLNSARKVLGDMRLKVATAVSSPRVNEQLLEMISTLETFMEPV